MRDVTGVCVYNLIFFSASNFRIMKVTSLYGHRLPAPVVNVAPWHVGRTLCVASSFGSVVVETLLPISGDSLWRMST